MDFEAVILGCGDMGKNHAQAWSERSDARVAAVFDLDPARSEALAAKHGAKACTSAEQALATPGVNVASVCLPVCLHRPLSELALTSGCHVLCEKPIALTDADARAMIATAARCQRQLAVSYQYRAFPANQRLRELFREGALGSPIFARHVDVREVRPKLAMHSRSQNGGPLIDMAGHFFDLMRFVTGAEPVSVTAHGHCFGRARPRLATVPDPAIDSAEILVHYTGGHVLSAYVCWGMPEGHPGMTSSYVTGPAGIVTQEQTELRLALADRTSAFRLPNAGWGPAGRIADLVGAIRGEHRLEVDGEVGRRALAVCLGALDSIATGKTVVLPQPEA